MQTCKEVDEIAIWYIAISNIDYSYTVIEMEMNTILKCYDNMWIWGKLGRFAYIFPMNHSDNDRNILAKNKWQQKITMLIYEGEAEI